MALGIATKWLLTENRTLQQAPSASRVDELKGEDNTDRGSTCFWQLQAWATMAYFGTVVFLEQGQ
jgi:hypothetical protein